TAEALSRNAYRYLGDAEYKIGHQPFRFADHIDAREALEDLFPQDAQLHLGDAIAHAAMNAEAKRNMMAGPVAVDAEFIGPLDHLFVAIARDVPHDDAVALPDLVALELDIAERRAAHMGERRLVADDLRDHVGDQARLVAQLLVFVRILVQREQAAGYRVARRVVAADDQQHQVAKILDRIVEHVPGRRIVRQQRDEIEFG